LHFVVFCLFCCCSAVVCWSTRRGKRSTGTKTHFDGEEHFPGVVLLVLERNGGMPYCCFLDLFCRFLRTVFFKMGLVVYEISHFLSATLSCPAPLLLLPSIMTAINHVRLQSQIILALIIIPSPYPGCLLQTNLISSDCLLISLRSRSARKCGGEEGSKKGSARKICISGWRTAGASLSSLLVGGRRDWSG
jgi:hypothetical protein